jgi:hypothetical protein
MAICGCLRQAQSERVVLGDLRAYTAGMEKEPEPTKPILWDIYRSIGVGEAGHVGMLVATVEAADENEAIEKVPPRLKQGGGKLMAAPAHCDAGAAMQDLRGLGDDVGTRS